MKQVILIKVFTNIKLEVTILFANDVPFSREYQIYTMYIVKIHIIKRARFQNE